MIWTLVLAAGAGTRYGARKQFEELGGRRIIDRSVDVALEASDGVVLVVPDGGDENDVGAGGYPTVDVCVTGGATRSASVRSGLSAVPDDAEIVVVHDAARPLAGRPLFDRVIGAVRDGADVAVPGVPVVATVKRVADGRVVETLDRSELVAVQTPQAFSAEVLRNAHAAGGDATDDAGLVEALGYTRVEVVEGEPGNIKVTVPSDLRQAELWLR